MFIFWVRLKENGLKHTNNAALTSAIERRQSKANTERENMKECGSCNDLKESTGLILAESYLLLWNDRETVKISLLVVKFGLAGVTRVTGFKIHWARAYQFPGCPEFLPL